MLTRAHGFSLVELIIVLVIVGALAVFAVPRLNIAGFSQYSFHEELLAATRHAQKTATASRCDIEMVVDAGSDSYSVEYTGAGPDECTAGPLTTPGGSGDLAGSAGSQVDITQGATITFDGFGVPDSRSRVVINGEREIIVEAITGYVHD